MSKITGTRLRSCRLRDNLRQEDVAREIGTSTGTIQRLEYGADMPVNTAKALAGLFNVSPAWLADLEVSADMQIEYQLEIRDNGKWTKATLPDGTETENIWNSQSDAEFQLTRIAILWDKAEPHKYSRGDYRILARYVGAWQPQLMLFDVFGSSDED